MTIYRLKICDIFFFLIIFAEKNYNFCFKAKLKKSNIYLCKPHFQYTSLVMRKPDFCICENKDADQLRSNREADQRLCFRYMAWIVQSLFYLNPKLQASSHLLWLCSLVCVGPCRKPRRPVFSQRGSYISVNPIFNIQKWGSRVS